VQDAQCERIFETNTSDVTRGLRKLHNKELNEFYLPPIIIMFIRSKNMRKAEYATGMEKNACRILGRIPERNVLFGKPREEDIIKVDCNLKSGGNSD
jgi:hypothetical protein